MYLLSLSSSLYFQKRLGVSKEEFHQMQFGGGRGGGGGGGNNQQQAAAPVAAVVEVPKVKEFFDLKLVSFDAKAKIKVIKEVRTVTALGLKEVCRSYINIHNISIYLLIAIIIVSLMNRIYDIHFLVRNAISVLCL